MIRGNFRTLVPGKAFGRVAALAVPLSLWGGLDLATGQISDVSHPDVGLSLKGKVLVMPGARGSSSSSSALVEAVRSGIAPAAIILSRVDPILVIGGLVASDLYGVQLPILLADDAAWAALPTDGELEVDAFDGGNAIATVR
jgi:predicted aconitase with swiveling domain